jgi:hypothetical protein
MRRDALVDFPIPEQVAAGGTGQPRRKASRGSRSEGQDPIE